MRYDLDSYTCLAQSEIKDVDEYERQHVEKLRYAQPAAWSFTEPPQAAA